MENYFIFIWPVILVLMLVIEFATVQLTTVWFAVGAAAALIAAACGVKNFLLQFTVFIAVSLLALIFTKPLVKKIIQRKTVPTNSDRCIGERAVVTQEINNLHATGAVKVNGVEWTARSEKNTVIPVNAEVTVIRIDGVKVIVE